MHRPIRVRAVSIGAALRRARVTDPLSRQDVRQQLIQSERDGQLSTLDHTIYKGN